MHSRRELLERGLGALCGLCLGCAGPKGESASESASPACDPPVPGGAAEGWVEVSLAEHPALLAVGGQSAVSVPEALLELLIAQPEEGCYLALWRICTHGACDVSWEAEAREVVCPCHESRFTEEGEVVLGPATEPLRSFPVARVGESLWVYRPL